MLGLTSDRDQAILLQAHSVVTCKLFATCYCWITTEVALLVRTVHFALWLHQTDFLIGDAAPTADEPVPDVCQCDTTRCKGDCLGTSEPCCQHACPIDQRKYITLPACISQPVRHARDSFPVTDAFAWLLQAKSSQKDKS